MLYINSVSETMETLKSIYQIHEPKEEISSSTKLAEYVFNECYYLIPQSIRDFFNLEEEESKLKSELILHLIINAYMVQLIETDGYAKLSGALFTKIFNLYNIAAANSEENTYHLFGDKDISRIAKDHFGKLLAHWMVPPSDNNPSAIPSFLVPLLAFQSIHFDAHKVLKSYNNNQHSRTYLSNLDNNEKLHLDFYNNFKYLLDRFLTLKKFERIFENKQVTYHPTINRILFEREYHLGLASKIIMMVMHYPEEIKNRYIRILSLAAMLPNISGRLFYLTNIFIGNIHFHQIEPMSEDEFKIENLITEEEKFIKIESICKDLIGMSLITIPVMESFFLYLWKNRNGTFDNDNMKKVMSKYEKIVFNDDPVKSEGTKTEGAADNMFGYKLNGEWELAELPFSDFRDLLKIINKITESQRQKLRNIYLTPYQFLEKNSYDTYNLLILKRNKYNIQALIEAISEVVEEIVFED